jgi:hypothetical protein
MYNYTHLCESVFRLHNFNTVGCYYLFRCTTCFGRTTIFKHTHLYESVFCLRNFNIVGFYYLVNCATCFGHTTIFNTQICVRVFSVYATLISYVSTIYLIALHVSVIQPTSRNTYFLRTYSIELRRRKTLSYKCVCLKMVV